MLRSLPVLLRGILASPANAQRCAPRSYPLMAFEVEREAKWMPDSSSRWVPGSPGTRSNAPTTVELVFQFVVDSAGKVLPSTIHALTPIDADRLRDIRADAARWHFQPAAVAGCRVAQLVQVPVNNGR